jgi:hypothetical protein
MKRIDTYQNLVLIALADNQITEAERTTIHQYAQMMGIPNEEASNVLVRIDQLAFIIPETREEKINELYKVALIALADNELSDDEYDDLLYFADCCGFTEEELNNVIHTASEKMAEQDTLLIKDNQLQYDQVLENIRKSGMKDSEIASLLLQCTQSRNLNMVFSNNMEVNEAFYKFLWLMYCRYVLITKGGILMLAMQIELTGAGKYSLDDIIYDFKLSEEGYFDGKKILVSSTGLDQIRKELKNNFPFSS